jgi:hypothetical protein
LEYKLTKVPIHKDAGKVGSEYAIKLPVSLAYMIPDKVSCLRLLTHFICCARNLALESAGSSMAARMAMMAMTTSSSIKVKARAQRGESASLSGEYRFGKTCGDLTVAEWHRFNFVFCIYL